MKWVLILLFLARQKHIVLDGKDYYMDLLFYHRTLRRLVLIELKLGEFEPQDKGQTELYLRWLEKNEKAEGEESPVALIFFAEKSQETIEFLQLMFRLGTVQIADIVYNTLGGVVGELLILF